MENKIALDHNAEEIIMRRTYTITSARTELDSVPVETRKPSSTLTGGQKLLIGNTDNFQAIAMEENYLKRSNSVQPKTGTKQTPIPKRQISLKHTLLSKADSSNTDKQANHQPHAQRGKRDPVIDYWAFQIPPAGLPFPKMRDAPRTKEEVMARRKALGILTTPDKLGQLAAGQIFPPVELEAVPVSSKSSTLSSSFSTTKTDLPNSSVENPHIKSTEINTPSPTSTATLLNSSPLSPPSDSVVTTTLTPLVTVHRSDLDELVYRARPLSIYDARRLGLPNTHVARLVAEVTELRNRERRYQDRGRAIEDLAIELVLGENAAPGSKSRVRLEKEKEETVRRKEDEEQRRKDFAPPMSAKEMERRNGAVIIGGRRGLGEIKE